MEYHPAADVFPMLPDDELGALAEDIEKHGQREPICLFEGKILDGRNRYRACEMKGITPATVDVNTDDPFAFVASANIHRRHLDASQRAMAASKLATLRDGERKQGASQDAPTQSEAAKLLNVSRPSVQRAREVQEHGVPELVDAVEKGEIGVKPASEFAKTVPPIDQQRLIKEHGSPAAAVKATLKARAGTKAKAAEKQPAKQSKDAFKGAADRRAKEIEKRKQKTHDARASYVVAATASCSSPADWEGEHDTVTDLLNAAQERKHGESQTSGQVH
jgi:ParB-like chromosome segregation protein Spo0J